MPTILSGPVYRNDEPNAIYIGGVALAEALERFVGQRVNVVWVDSLAPIPSDHLATFIASAVWGDVEADFAPRYSEITGYLWTDETGIVGGHDLIAVFDGLCTAAERQRQCVYAVLVISIEPIDLLALDDLS